MYGKLTGIDIEDEFSGVQFHRSFAGSRVAIGKITTNNVYPHNLTFDFRTRSSESQLLMLLTNRKPHHDDFIPRHSRGSNIPDFFAIYISNWGFPRITCSFRCGRMSGVMVHYQRLDKNNWHKVTFNAETSYVSYDEYSNALQCGMPDVCREDLKYMYMGGMPERFLPKSLLKEMLPARTLRGCIRKLRFNGRQQSVSARYIAVSSCC
ncbi:uncharacterized protein LOC141902318 isoform X2 [Tubulanus polymorphus]|uniref:uncharacterized protein LOC141902318 isoform X2 n=1 Tax=Tubulanus polymorphus TaxID=672921 RepID=UPI003DA3DF1F